MNYSQLEIEKKQKKLTSTSSKMRYRMREWGKYCGVLGVIIVVLLLVFGIAGTVRGLVDSAPKMEALELMPTGNSSKMYDSDGEVIQTLGEANSFQEYVQIDRIPQCVQYAFVAIEDSRFFEHHGVDMQGIIRTVYRKVTSEPDDNANEATITQQLIRNQIMAGTGENNLVEKLSSGIKEQYLAIELENNLDKKEILEDYLNTISMDESTLGVQAASKKYFDKDISNINISEAAVLAAMVDDPAEYNPVSKQEENAERRKIVLKSMLDAGFISEDEYEDALGDDVYLRIQNVTTSTGSEESVNSYYADAVVEQVITDLKEKLGYTQTQAYNTLYHGGLKIYTCQDRGLQSICDTTINNDDNYPKGTKSYLSYTLVIEHLNSYKEYSEIDVKNYFANKGEKISLYFTDAQKAQAYINEFRRKMLREGGSVVNEDLQLVKQPQASFVLMEQSTGEIKALVGGRGTKNKNSALNRATEVTYQPGTALGILSTYVPALDTAGMTLANVEEDAEYTTSDTEKKVIDWNQKEYKGLVTLRSAIVDSINVPAVKVLEKISPQTGFDYLSKMGFSTLVESKSAQNTKESTDIRSALALGKLTQGVTNMELTSAYAALANTGVYQKARLYTRIVDQDGNILIENSPVSTRIMKDSTAWLITNALEEGVHKGFAQKADLENEQIAIAGVKGTNSDNAGYWFEGYTPYYTAGIWSGEDEGTKVASSDYYIKIWKMIMDQIHAYSKISLGDFTKPENIVARRICQKSGKLAVEGLCEEEDKSNVKKEYFVRGTEPEENCDVHVKYAYRKGSDMLADENCPKEDIEYRVVLKNTNKK